ncbi:MAG: hypothetical protein N2234_07260 [Planctomycetota bacterium]|nr:hypothetical protein [Planctomycetota bacterium]
MQRVILLVFLVGCAGVPQGGSFQAPEVKPPPTFTAPSEISKPKLRKVNLNGSLSKTIATALIYALTDEEEKLKLLLEDNSLRASLDDYLFVTLFGLPKPLRFFSRARTYRDALTVILSNLKKDSSRPRKLPKSLAVRVEEVEGAFRPETAEEVSQNIRFGLDSLMILTRNKERNGEESFLMSDEILTRSIPDSRCLHLLLLTRYSEDTLFVRFRTVSFLHLYPEDETVSLFRLRRVEVVANSSTVKRAVSEAADYLVRIQKENGLFGYFYDAATDKFIEGESYIRQAGTACALLQVYDLTKERRYLTAAEKSLSFLRSVCKEHPQHKFAFIREPDGATTLGSAAVLLWALANHKDVTGSEEFAPVAHNLASFLLFMQSSDGSFNTVYDPATDSAMKTPVMFHPGEAVLALASAARSFKEERYLNAAVKAYRALAAECAHRLKSEPYHIDAWLMKSANVLAPHLKSSDFDVVYSMANTLVAAQKALLESPYLDYRGAFSVKHGYPSAISDAALCEGLAAAYSIAVSTSNLKAKEYADALKLQACFHLRHRIDRTNGHFLPNLERAYGAFISSPFHLQVRIDGVQHTISALLDSLPALPNE